MEDFIKDKISFSCLIQWQIPFLCVHQYLEAGNQINVHVVLQWFLIFAVDSGTGTKSD